LEVLFLGESDESGDDVWVFHLIRRSKSVLVLELEADCN
jgi:hypothetical protein